MRLELGATVRSADGHVVGTLKQFVIDANTRAVTQLILQTGRFHNHDLLVPLDAIARKDDDNTLHLTLDAPAVHALPEFEALNFVVSEHAMETQWRYLIPTAMTGGTIPSAPGGGMAGAAHVYDPGRDALFGVEDPTNERIETWSSLPEWDYREGKGTKVVTRDDHTVGVLHEVDVDAAGKPRTIVVATGVLHRGRRTLPIAMMQSANSHRIRLNMTRDEFEQLAE